MLPVGRLAATSPAAEPAKLTVRGDGSFPSIPLVVTVEAEDKLAFQDCLAEITAPTLVAGGENDPFYTPALFRETANGIPNAQLCLYPNMGHPASGKQFHQDILAFLREEMTRGV